MILKFAAAFAVVTAAGAAPAMASCGVGLLSGCYGYGHGYGASYQQLPDPAHQYYYVNQGPTFSGPGNFAPTQYYQETSTLGWTGYDSGGVYDGGPYANPVNHYSYARPYRHAAVQYRYRPRVRPYGYSHRSYARR